MSIRVLPAWLAALLAIGCAGPLCAESPTIELVPRQQPGETTRVAVELDMGGQLQVRPEDAEKGTLGEIRQLPMSVVGSLHYDERHLDEQSDAKSDNLSARAVRYYDQAEATIKVDQGGEQPRLPDDRRLVVVQRADGRTTFSSPAGPLTRGQLDLINEVGDSLLISKLLPTKPVAEGDTWKQDSDLMAALLRLDTVAVCEVQSVLEQFNKDYAKVRLAGTVHGTVDGAATEMDVRAVYLFDRAQGRITRLNWAVREQRAIGGATPGVEGIAKLQVKVDPLEHSDHLTDEVVSGLPPADEPAADDLVYEAAPQGFRIRHDSQWFVTGEERETITLGRVDRTGLVAQCSITLLPPKSADEPTTLEEFQQDIVRSLGKNYGQLVSSKQWTTRHGLHVIEAIVQGKVEDIPVEWHYYLVAPTDGGHRETVAVTIEGEMVKRLGEADRKLVDSLELIPTEHSVVAPPATSPQPSEPTPAGAAPGKTAARSAPATK
jgi:hypothetical protein